MKWWAEYQCLECNHMWSEAAGPTQCLKCGHLYVRWTNYEALAKQARRGIVR